jgi:hypothetical protein
VIANRESWKDPWKKEKIKQEARVRELIPVLIKKGAQGRHWVEPDELTEF